MKISDTVAAHSVEHHTPSSASANRPAIDTWMSPLRAISRHNAAAVS